MIIQPTDITLQNVRFLTRPFALLWGLAGIALLSKALVLLSKVILGDESTKVSIERFPLVVSFMLAAWLAFSFLLYQIRVISILRTRLRKMQRHYFLFGAMLFRHDIDLEKWTWIQPKTAHVGSKKLVIDAGNDNEKNKTHLIEMPPEATWSETLVLGKLIADQLSMEFKPYHDKIIGLSSAPINDETSS